MLSSLTSLHEWPSNNLHTLLIVVIINTTIFRILNIIDGTMTAKTIRTTCRFARRFLI